MSSRGRPASHRPCPHARASRRRAPARAPPRPQVPHPRWSQASEQELVDSPAARGFIRTTIFNNYTSEVAYMYGPERSYYF